MPEKGGGGDKKRKHAQGGRGSGGAGGGGGEGGDKAGKKLKYFAQQAKGGAGQAVPLGSRGILITCDATREDKAAVEAVALIEEHYDNLRVDVPPGTRAAPAAAATAAAAAAAAAAPAAAPAAAADAAPAAASAGATAEAEEAGAEPAAAPEEPAAASDAAAGEEAKAAGGEATAAPAVAEPPAAAKDAAVDAKEAGAASGAGGSGGGGGGGGSKDIAALLAEEVAAIKERKGARFRVHHTGVKGVVYILFPTETPGAPGPAAVAHSIAQEAQQKKQVRGRHVVRFLPVTHTCFAGLEELKAAAPKLVAEHFPEGEGVTPVEFAVEYEHRAADGFGRLDVINAFTACIKTPPHKVNLTNPTLVILVQLIRNGCAMAVVPGYKQLAKFNVRKLAEVEE